MRSIFAIALTLTVSQAIGVTKTTSYSFSSSTSSSSSSINGKPVTQTYSHKDSSDLDDSTIGHHSRANKVNKISPVAGENDLLVD